MEGKNEINEELNEIAPFLSKIDKKNNFSVHDNYFEDFPARVRDKIGYKSTTLSWTNIFGLFSRKAVFALSSLAIIAILVTMLTVNFNRQSLAKAVTPNEYILDNIDEDLIIDELAFKEAPKSKIQSTTDNTEEYILENIEESTISEEL
jgi:hypothetical protein